MDIFTVINCVVNGLMMFTSTTGNFFVLFAIVASSSLHSASNVFLCNLAVSDLLVGFAMQPVYIAYELVTKSRPFLTITARLLFGVCCGVSLCSMTALSVDRFLTLHYHLLYPNMMTQKRALCVSFSLWFIAIALSAFSLWHGSQAVLAIAILICVIVSCFSYVRIYQIVRHHRSVIHSQQVSVQRVSTSLAIKSAINTFIYFICMVFCYFPMFTSMLIYTINPGVSSEYWTITNTFVFMNSSLNPLLYCWRLRELRSAVSKKMRKMLCKQTDETPRIPVFTLQPK